jgi:uncharacterized membrane protein YgcG
LSAGTRPRVAVLFAVLLLGSVVVLAQQAPPPPDQTLSPDQLNDLVAPIALYPDPLLSQVLVAATYPLEVVQAYQWAQKNTGMGGPALTQAAQQQNWDASVQALAVFPDVLKRLNDDVAWTTNLGNAFLAQQQDVMDAVQRMRQKAQQAGKLQSTAQENVVTTTDAGQPYIDIEPANPEVIYVPVYDPVWIWGPPMWYPYPHWWWPPRSFLTGGLYFGFGGPIDMGIYFGAGWHGWGGWGWHPGWGNHSVIVNNMFIHRYNFNGGNVTNVRGTSVWAHDATHRAGVPYANQSLRTQYQGNVRQNMARPSAGQVRTQMQQQGERFGNREVPRNVAPAQNRGVFGGMDHGAAARQQADHGYSSMGAARSSPAPRAAPAQRSAPAPRTSGGGGGGGRPAGGGGGGGHPAGGGGRGGR